MAEGTLLVGDSYSDQNLYYTTHFLAGDPFLYLQADGRTELITSSMERGRAEKESSVENVRTFEDFGYRDLIREGVAPEDAFLTLLERAVRDAGLDRVTVETAFPALYADHLRGVGIGVDIDPRLLRLQRRQKTEAEIAAIEEAQRATERATQRAVDLLGAAQVRDGLLYLEGSPLTSERLRTEIEVDLVRQDMDAGSPIVAGGPGAADPHWIGSGPLKAGESIVMDIFPRSKRTRYYADMTRTVVRGEPSELLTRMYSAVLRAQEAALGRIRAGVHGEEVHKAVEAVFEEEGFAGEGPGPRYTHGTGHGVGLDIHEAPSLGRSGRELVENDVVTVEPGLYDPSVGAIRIEDLVVVTSDGCRNLTRFPKRFQIEV